MKSFIYRLNNGVHTLITTPTEEDMRKMTILDVAQDARGYAEIQDVGLRLVSGTVKCVPAYVVYYV